jgi:hypothetical protein
MIFDGIRIRCHTFYGRKNYGMFLQPSDKFKRVILDLGTFIIQ